MRCQDVERLILNVDELSAGERAEVDSHLAGCGRCSDWREFWKTIHECAASAPPGLPPGLSERVRRAARAELALPLEARAARSGGPGAGVPRLIWAAMGAVAVLSIGFLVPAVQAFIQDQKLTLGASLALGLILQNALTLVFAPVVLKRENRFQGGHP